MSASKYLASPYTVEDFSGWSEEDWFNYIEAMYPTTDGEELLAQVREALEEVSGNPNNSYEE